MRFQYEKSASPLRSILVSVAVFAAVFTCFYFSVEMVSGRADAQQEENLRDALKRSVIHCYAVEGAYPESLAYLKENYGVTYDPDRFFVDYLSQGANIMPEITVIAKDKK